MDVIYKLGQATVADVLENLSDAPGYSSVRTILGVLVEKDYLWYKRESHHYVYHPTMSAEEARTSILEHVVDTFFQGSVTEVVSALMDLSDDSMSADDYEEIIQLISKTRQEGR